MDPRLGRARSCRAHPLHLFQANIFYPADDTLAFSEPLIVPALLGAPIAWLGGSPVLVFNLLMIAGFALTAFAGYALVFAWTGDAPRPARRLDVRVQHAHADAARPRAGVAPLGLPLALLAADRLVATARVARCAAGSRCG